MNNQRGGVISKLFVIPAGVVVIIAMFVLGYYVGRHQGKKSSSADKPPALPDVVSDYLPKKEDFTFYKTLTEAGDKTVSIELKTKPKKDDAPAKKEAPASAAAKQEHEKPAARTPVQEATKPKAPAAKADRAGTAKQRFTVQVGSYPERGQAEEEVRNMKKRGYAAFVVASDIPDKGRWFRVRVGSFSNKQSAERLAGQMKAKDGIASFITAE